MATQTTKGTGNVKKDSGSVLGGGNIASSRWNNLSVINDTFKSYNWGMPVAHPLSGILPGKLGGAVAITGITQSGSTGYVNIQKSTHGLAVNDIIVVYGTDVTGYNTTHTVTVVTDANNVQTNVKYTADAVTPGSYKLLSGIFDALTANCYIGMVIGKDSAGRAINVLRSPGADTAYRKAIAAAAGNYRYNITSWDYVTGIATKGGSAGASVTYTNISSGSALASEPAPTRAIPGELTYSIGTNVPTMADYKQRNG